MSPRHLNATWIAAGWVGLALGVRLVAAPLVRVALPQRVATAAQVAAPPVEAHPDSLAAALVARDPFRITRRPSDVVYAPKPVLAPVGIVWDSGRDPTALVEGLPGVEGPRPVRSGEAIAGLRVKAIKPDRVVVTGLDTTWTLTVREPWR